MRVMKKMPQAKERSLRRTQTCQHFDSGLSGREGTKDFDLSLSYFVIVVLAYQFSY